LHFFIVFDLRINFWSVLVDAVVVATATATAIDAGTAAVVADVVITKILLQALMIISYQ
jgi:hypothetical protein